jgi:uncharacterized protein with beta-barrel porin domain
MNKAYRVVWSQVRNCFVVASEKTKTKGKPSTTRTAIAAAVAALFLAPGIASAVGCFGTTPVSTTLTDPQCYTDVNVTVNSTGSIAVTNANTAAYVSLVAPYTSTFTNNGTISAINTTHMNGSWYGAYFNNGIAAAGKLTNSGNITVDIGPSGWAYGSGVYINGDVAGTLTNSGHITASVIQNSSGSAYAYGINVNSISGTLTNSGTISATAKAGADSAFAYGVSVGGNLSGSLINSGTISATANAYSSSYAQAYGVYVDGDLSGTLTNSGTISATATNTYSYTAYAHGVYVSGDLSGTLTNSGTISATANANTSHAYAYGVYVGNNLDGRLINSGTISATANVYSDSPGYAYGVYVSGNLSGTLTNSGTISATATNTYDYTPYAYGVYVGSDLSGSLTNSGTIHATATGNTSNNNVYAYGVYVDGDLSGTLTNSGTISASALNNYSYARAYGVYVNNDLSGSLTNSGTISASAVAPYPSWVEAYGVYVGNLAGTLTNSGTISAVADGSTSGSAYGVYVGNNLDGTLTNSGTISAKGLGATLDGNVYSIYASGGSGTINNLAGGLLDGRVYAGGTVNLNNDGTINTRLNNSSVGGDYAQGATGVLTIGAVSTGSYGSLSAGGTATLAAGTTIRVNADPAHSLGNADVLNNVISASTLTCSTTADCSAIKVQDNILGLNFTAAKNGNDVDLTAATVAGLTTVAAATAGGAGAGAGAVLDTLLATAGSQPTGLSDLLFAVGAAGSAQEVSDIVAQALPLMSGGLTQVTVGNLNGVNRVIQARQEGNRGLSSGDSFVSNRMGWIKPLGSWADQKNRNGTFGYDAKTYGVALGADGELSNVARLGAAFAYTNSNVDGNSGTQNADINSYQAVLYGSRSLDEATELNWQADYAYNQNKGQRRVVGLTASSKYNSDSFHVGAGIGRTMTMNPLTTFTPSFRADYTTIHDQGYAETGAGGLNLTVNGRTTDQFVLAVDGKVAHKLNDNATLIANMGLGYDVNAKQNSVTAAFAGGGAAFTTLGLDPSATTVRGGLGYVSNMSGGTEITARYDVEGRSGFTAQTASVKWRMPF